MDTSENLFFGELLQQFRKRKRLNQKQLAARIEVSRETVSLWERGEYKPEADRVLYKIVNVLGLTTQEQRQLFEAYTVTALATSFHHPPLKRNPYFTGRSSQLDQLHTLLMAGKQVALTQAISGLGGIGKTQLALEYAYRHQKSYHDIFWVNADTEESLMASYVLLAGLLRLPEYEEPDQNKVKKAVQHWLRKHTGWLLILDNIEDLSLLQQFVPSDRQGAVLLTTRRQVTEPAAQAIELELLPENDAILFLLKRTKVLTIEMSLEEASDHEIEAARVIAQLLGDLPLALDQAGAYILETQCSFADYSALFKICRDQLLQRRIGEGIPTDHSESVTATFRLNFQQVQQRNEAAGELLRMCTFLAPDGIGEEIFVRGASKLGPILQPLSSNGLLLNQVIEILRAFSLIQRDSQEKTVSIHRLVQAVLQDTLSEEERRLWVERAMLSVNAAFPRVEYNAWSQCERLLSHALQLTQCIETYQVVSEDAGHLLQETACYLHARARYAEAEPLYLHALQIWEQHMGPDHPHAATTFYRLATLYAQQGKYAQAEPLYLHALQIKKQHMGPDHPEIVYPLNDLAILYAQQGKYAEAEPLYRRALQIREQHMGPDHPVVAHSLNGLAALYQYQGKYTEAEPLYKRVLQIKEQHMGPDHPAVATTLHGLADLYREQSKYAEAESLYRRALQTSERHMGPNHLDVTYPLTGLADLYREQGKYAEAEPLYLSALRIWEQQVEPKHPDRAYPLHSLASLYREWGQYTQAEALFQCALDIREKALGLEHPQTAETMHGLAQLRELQGQREEAREWYFRALAVRERTLGTHDPQTMEARRSYITLLYATGKDEEAAQLEAAESERGTNEKEQKIPPEE